MGLTFETTPDQWDDSRPDQKLRPDQWDQNRSGQVLVSVSLLFKKTAWQPSTYLGFTLS